MGFLRQPWHRGNTWPMQSLEQQAAHTPHDQVVAATRAPDRCHACQNVFVHRVWNGRKLSRVAVCVFRVRNNDGEEPYSANHAHSAVHQQRPAGDSKARIRYLHKVDRQVYNVVGVSWASGAPGAHT